jgi:tRNA(Ile)-lysidine synthase
VAAAELSLQIAERIADLVARALPRVPGPGLLVALSGGPDSVALLLGAHRWASTSGNPLASAHLDHQLRGTASDEDARFCARLCAELNIPLFQHTENVDALARRRGLGLEEAGRHARRSFLADLLQEHDHLHLVAKGQHRNDQAETVIMRLFRGTGPDGMAGIRPVHGNHIHPLLDFSREEILEFLEQSGQQWRTDASNLAGDNLRARLRRELLPLVRDIFGAGCDLTPARLAALWENDLAHLEDLTRQSLARITADSAGRPALQVGGLLELPRNLALRCLRLWLTSPIPEEGRSSGADPARLEMVHLLNILEWLRVGQSGTALDLPGGIILRREFDTLVLAGGGVAAPAPATAADYRVSVQRCREAADPESLGRTEGSGTGDEHRGWNLTVPADVLQGNLRIRNPRPGDRFQPFGLDGTRKLSDLFRDLRLPEPTRARLLVVEDDLGILWIVGHARSQRTRLLPSTARMVTISVKKR